jgi:hypothetical protein
MESSGRGIAAQQQLPLPPPSQLAPRWCAPVLLGVLFLLYPLLTAGGQAAVPCVEAMVNVLPVQASQIHAAVTGGSQVRHALPLARCHALRQARDALARMAAASATQ